MAPSRARLVLAFLAIYLIWGSTYLAIRIALEAFPPFLMAGARFLIAGGGLYAWLRLRGARPPTRIEWRSAALIGGLMLLGGNGGVCWAEQRVPSGLTALLVGGMPLWIALIQWFRPGGRPPRGTTWLALALGMAGVGLIVGPGEFAGGRGIDPLGALALCLSTLGWASGTVLSKSLPLPASPMMATAAQMIAGGALLALLGLSTGETARIHDFPLRASAALGYLVVAGSLVAYSAYVWLLRATSAVKVATYAYVNPIVAVVLGWAVAGEPLSPRIGIAAAAILGSVAILTRAGSSPPGGLKRA